MKNGTLTFRETFETEISKIIKKLLVYRHHHASNKNSTYVLCQILAAVFNNGSENCEFPDVLYYANITQNKTAKNSSAIFQVFLKVLQ